MSDQYKRVLCLFSGGLDSTGMVYQYLNEGFIVDTLYVEILNNEEQTKREKRAVRHILSILRDTELKGKLGTHEYRETRVVNPDKMYLAMVPVLIHTLYEHVDLIHEHAAIGYCMGDDAISFLREIRNLWNSHRFLKPGNPQLKFPFAKVPKSTIYNSLPSNILDYVTWCESPVPIEGSCGECRSCHRMKNWF